jgi:hypothetical protein
MHVDARAEGLLAERLAVALPFTLRQSTRKRETSEAKSCRPHHRVWPTRRAAPSRQHGACEPIMVVVSSQIPPELLL